MEIRHLKYFLTLAEELHFGQAAEKLFISQPPLSRLIKSLEEELGIPLFERNNRIVKLTRYGEYFKSQAIDILSQIENTKNQLHLMKDGLMSPIKIGYVASLMYVFLPDVLKKLKTKFPQVNTILIEINNPNQYGALLTGDLDIGFVRNPESHKEIIFDHIYDESYSLIYSTKHKIHNNKLSIKDFINEPFITFTSECSTMKAINELLKSCNIKPNIVHQTSQINTILRLVESNMGYAIIPTSVLRGFKLNIKRIDL